MAEHSAFLNKSLWPIVLIINNFHCFYPPEGEKKEGERFTLWLYFAFEWEIKSINRASLVKI